MAQNLAQFVISIFTDHKLKVLTSIVSAIVFFVLLFPFDDLSDLVTIKVSELTGNNVYITFDTMDLSLLPAPNLELGKVKLITRQIPGIEASSLRVYPSLLSLLAMKPGFSTKAQDIFKGEVNLGYKEGSKTESGQILQDVEFNLENIELSELNSLIRSPIRIKGRASAEGQASIDPSFEQQILAELSLATKKILIPAASLELFPGADPTEIPQMNFSNFDLKAKMEEGGLQILQMDLGTSKDPISLQVKGQLGLKIVMRGGKPVAEPGSFNIRAKIVTQPRKLDPNFNLILGFISSYKKTSGGLDTYMIKAVGSNFRGVPKISALQKFE